MRRLEQHAAHNTKVADDENSDERSALSEAKTAGWLFPLTHWNWKVALVTAVLRGLACVAALRHMEAHARNHFGVVEAAFVLLTCGFFSALQQQSLSIRSEMLAWFSCVVVVPLTSLGCDAGLHFWLDGRQTRQLGIPALVFTVVSATFHWHMIRNGALLVGDESHSLSDRSEADSEADGDVFCVAGVVDVEDWRARWSRKAKRRLRLERAISSGAKAHFSK